MFTFKVEGCDWALKPMNCPAHCLMYSHRLRSWRELPLRLADFGVLHRNELSGALTGLTRVRRFQQDDGHVFCRPDQIGQEVLGALNFMKEVYETFGMTYKLELSTRPAKAVGADTPEGLKLWDDAEAEMEKCLNEFVGKGNWRINKGDGAFYGPKIDIKVMDALNRKHQCATVQLDFQLPIRFDLQYKAEEEGKFARPVIVHRAMLGSVERMFAILTEHYGGKWPLWISPRQAIVLPLAPACNDAAVDLQRQLHAAGIYAEAETSAKRYNKKVREAQLAQWNFILSVGEKEMAAGTVDVRTRDNKRHGVMPREQLVKIMRAMCDAYSNDSVEATLPQL